MCFSLITQAVERRQDVFETALTGKMTSRQLYIPGVGIKFHSQCIYNCADLCAQMIHRETRPPPESWAQRIKTIRHRWTLLWHAPEFAFEWVAYYLNRWAFLEVLEYLGIFSVLFAVIFYYSEAGDRKKQKHYQAWQVINTAQGRGGSGGRIEALQELNSDRVELAGVDVSGSYLQGIELRHANLIRANFETADLRDCDFEKSDLQYADLKTANLRRCSLRSANLGHADLEDADLYGASLTDADLNRASLKNADLRNADLRGVKWRGLKDIEAANIYGVRNSPEGFVSWAVEHGAIAERGDAQ